MSVIGDIKNSKFIQSLKESFGALMGNTDVEVIDDKAVASNNDAVAKAFAVAENNIINFEDYVEKTKETQKTTKIATTRKAKSYEEQALANSDIDDEFKELKVK